MIDIYDSSTRSYNMSRVKGKDTKPEMLVRRYLHGRGLRYTLHNAKLPGKPDLTLPKYRTVVFVNGCFWHGHEGCRYYTVPKTDTEKWLSKIEGNRQRDTRDLKLLEEAGWRVITVWECELKGKERREALEGLYKRIVTEEQIHPTHAD